MKPMRLESFSALVDKIETINRQIDAWSASGVSPACKEAVTSALMDERDIYFRSIGVIAALNEINRRHGRPGFVCTGTDTK